MRGDDRCVLCGRESQKTEHFLIRCGEFVGIRERLCAELEVIMDEQKKGSYGGPV